MTSATPTVTATIAGKTANLRYQHLTPEAREIAKQCVMDFLGVAIAGADDALTVILDAIAEEDSGAPVATVVGRGTRTSMANAALINGAMSHALDYDDVNFRLGGHPTVPVAPGVLALAEQRGLNGRDVITAFVAGVEAECRVGQLMGKSHYAKGWHNTGTIGTFGSAAGCAHALGLDAERTRHALGIAGTQAAGLKSVFGTMCKPLHAGKAAQNGLQAARWAARGFTSNPDILDVPQGFAATATTTPDPDAARRDPPEGFHIPQTLFKYHAACYMTHSSIEAVATLRERHGLRGEQVERIVLNVDQGHFSVCNIAEPGTGLEAKFSLRLTAAMAFAGRDTSSDGAYTDAMTQEAELVALRDKVEVKAATFENHSASEVVIRLRDGREVRQLTDVGIPMTDLDAQWRKLEAKFRALCEPRIGKERTDALVAACRDLENQTDIAAVLALTRIH